jgi:hypothetical protein
MHSPPPSSVPPAGPSSAGSWRSWGSPTRPRRLWARRRRGTWPFRPASRPSPARRFTVLGRKMRSRTQNAISDAKSLLSPDSASRIVFRGRERRRSGRAPATCRCRGRRRPAWRDHLVEATSRGHEGLGVDAELVPGGHLGQLLDPAQATGESDQAEDGGQVEHLLLRSCMESTSINSVSCPCPISRRNSPWGITPITEPPTTSRLAEKWTPWGRFFSEPGSAKRTPNR